MVQTKIINLQLSNYFFVFLFLIVLLISLQSSLATYLDNGDVILNISNDNPSNDIRISLMNITFYANYSNHTGSSLNQTTGEGSCFIRFNETGIFTNWSNMSYSSSSLNWFYNRSFNYKFFHVFNINCTSSYGNINLSDNFTITNTQPVLYTDIGGSYINFDGNALNNDYWPCYEDRICQYNLSANVSDTDVNDILTYDYSSTANTTLTNFVLNTTTGILTINVTTNAINGTKTIELNVRDSGNDGVINSGTPVAGILRVDITAVNDAPIFLNLSDQIFNMSTLTEPVVFNYTIQAIDEENNVPFSLNISFLNCSVAQWSSRNCSNSTGRELFNSSSYTFNSTTGILNISFSPQRDDVGNYTINFTVTDLNNGLAPFNNSNSTVVTFRVLSKNTAPTLTYICGNERNWTEDSGIVCYANATDIEEVSNITYTANYSWFVFNETGNSSTNGTVVRFANLTTNFSSFAVVNFTPNDYNVGNWSISLVLSDTGSYGDNSKQSTTIFNFSISNVNDMPIFNNNLILNGSNAIYNSNSYVVYLNASDDDILIPDKTVYNERLSFNSNASWINASVCSTSECPGLSGTNITTAKITISLNSSISGNYSVKINVTDQNGAYNTTVLYIEVLNNSIPVWINISNNISVNEDAHIQMNLSQNVSHTDNWQNISFSFKNDTSFPSFSLNSTTGIIDFTTVEEDVGQHMVTINVSDNVSQSALIFNFTILNVNEPPWIDHFEEDGNITINQTNINQINMNTSSESNVTISIFVGDNDFKIPSAQKKFYNESLNITINLTSNSMSYNFLRFGSLSQMGTTNLSYTTANFMVNNTFAGNYTVSVNISDRSNTSVVLSFNLTILPVLHLPTVLPMGNQSISIFENFSLNVNASDSEDGSDTNGTNTNFSYSIANMSGVNFLAINSSSGVITNLSGSEIFYLRQHAGAWVYNVSVMDSSGLNASRLFTLFVYDYPVILQPLQGYNISLRENVLSVLNFSVNHSAQTDLNYSLYIREILRNQTTGYGNSSLFGWSFSSNFTDETCSGSVNLTLNVSNAKLSNISTWNLTITYTTSPLVLYDNIDNQNSTSPLTIYLDNYFRDIDASDSCHYQNISFSYVLSGSNATGIDVSITNWTGGERPRIVFTSSSEISRNYTVFAFEHNESNNSLVLRNATSNNFTVSIVKSTNVVETPSSGGGGSSSGGTTPTPEDPYLVLLKLIMPGPVSADKKTRIVLPISLVNGGKSDLNGINLSSFVAKNGSLVSGVNSSFDRSSILLIKKGESENVTLVIDIDTEESGLYEITVNATVRNPKYSDWGKVYLNLKNSTDVEQKFIFVEAMIVSNPECAEITELLKEARASFEKNELDKAEKELDAAINACNEAITQKQSFKAKVSLQNTLLNSLSIATICFFAFGILYYLYKRRRFRIEMGYQIPKK